MQRSLQQHDVPQAIERFERPRGAHALVSVGENHEWKVRPRWLLFEARCQNMEVGAGKSLFRNQRGACAPSARLWALSPGTDVQCRNRSAPAAVMRTDSGRRCNSVRARRSR